MSVLENRHRKSVLEVILNREPELLEQFLEIHPDNRNAEN